MRIRIRSALLSAIVALMASALAVVAVAVLINSYRLAEALGERAIEQAALDVEHRVAPFLKAGPAALQRLSHLIDRNVVGIADPERLAEFMEAEVRSVPELAWLSVSDAVTGAFIGVTRRDGRLILNRSSPEMGGGLPQEWEVRPDGSLMRLADVPEQAYDPRTKAWFKLALATEGRSWTDPYVFNEGRTGISVVTALREPASGRIIGVATADFELGRIDSFLAALRVGENGRAVVLAPRSAGGVSVLGAPDRLPAEMRSALAVGMEGGRNAARSPQGEDGGMAGTGAVIVDVRALDIEEGPPWTLAVMLPRADVEAPIRRATETVIVAALGFLLVGALVAAGIADAIARPIRRVAMELERIGELHFLDFASPRSRLVEVDAIAGALVRMTAGLRSFARYVPVDVVRVVLDSGRSAELGGETRPLTILFSDIAGFTGIVEGTPPEHLVPRLGRYFALMEDAIVEAGGVVDNFIGDAILAFFNAPKTVPNHVAHACAAALEAQRRLVAFNDEGAREGTAVFPTRIGLATGPVLVGNIGTPERLSYTAIGDPVNLASRLQGLNKTYGTSILATGEVRAASGEGFEWRYLDRVTVAGRTETLELHALLGVAGSVDAATLRVRDLHEMAVAALAASDFEVAERGFAAVLDAAPLDRAARILLTRTVELRGRQAC